MSKHASLFVDDRPEGGEGDPIVRLKDSGIETDPRIGEKPPSKSLITDLDILRMRIGDEAVTQMKTLFGESWGVADSPYLHEPGGSFDLSLTDNA